MDTVTPAQGDWGAVVTFTMRTQDGSILPLDAVSAVKAHVTKPDGSTAVLTGSVVGDGTAGQFSVTIADGTFADYGEYIIEPEVEFANGEYVGTVYKFAVRPSARS